MSSQDAAARARALSLDADACVRRGDLAAAETGYREALAIERLTALAIPSVLRPEVIVLLRITRKTGGD